MKALGKNILLSDVSSYNVECSLYIGTVVSIGCDVTQVQVGRRVVCSGYLPIDWADQKTGVANQADALFMLDMDLEAVIEGIPPGTAIVDISSEEFEKVLAE